MWYSIATPLFIDKQREVEEIKGASKSQIINLLTWHGPQGQQNSRISMMDSCDAQIFNDFCLTREGEGGKVCKS